MEWGTALREIILGLSYKDLRRFPNKADLQDLISGLILPKPHRTFRFGLLSIQLLEVGQLHAPWRSFQEKAGPRSAGF